MLAPVLALVLGIFIGGLVMGLMQSFGYFPAIGMKMVTLDYYKQVLTSPDFISSLSFSLYISLVSSVLSIIIGLALAYLLMKGNTRKQVEEVLYKLPIIVPHTVAALLVYSVFAQSGIVSRALFHLGFIATPAEMPAFLFDRTGRGIILAYMWKEIPFIAMVVYSVLKSVCTRLEDVARNLGASAWQTFRFVILPLIAPTLLSNFIIIFAFSFGAFEVPYLLGPTSPRALPILAFVEYTNPDLTHRPYTMSINMILTFISLGIVGGVSLMFRRIFKYKV
jgi:putative spermidine/putrescine transport system permease protein